jgi:hypothetical protein
MTKADTSRRKSAGALSVYLLHRTEVTQTLVAGAGCAAIDICHHEGLIINSLTKKTSSILTRYNIRRSKDSRHSPLHIRIDLSISIAQLDTDTGDPC